MGIRRAIGRSESKSLWRENNCYFDVFTVLFSISMSVPMRNQVCLICCWCSIVYFFFLWLECSNFVFEMRRKGNSFSSVHPHFNLGQTEKDYARCTYANASHWLRENHNYEYYRLYKKHYPIQLQEYSIFYHQNLRRNHINLWNKRSQLGC